MKKLSNVLFTLLCLLLCIGSFLPAHAKDAAISFEKSSISINENKTCTLFVTDPSATNDVSFSYKIDDESIAIVDKSYKDALKIAAKNYGTTKVTVTSADKKTNAECTINVYCSTFTVNDMTVNIGETATINPIFAKDYTFKNNISYSASNTSVATVSNGVITPQAIGRTRITATIPKAENEGATDDVDTIFNVTVVQPVTSITEKDSYDITVGKTITLHPKVLPEDATDKTVTYKSADEKIATVTKGGIVTAKTVGKTTITITSVNDVKKVITITAKPAEIVSITPSSDTVTITTGTVGNITFTVDAEGNTDYISLLKVTSSDSTVAYPSMPIKTSNTTFTVSVAGMKVGTSNVTVTSKNNVTATITVTVADKVETTPVASSDATPTATPVASSDATPTATPVASSDATPTATADATPVTVTKKVTIGKVNAKAKRKGKKVTITYKKVKNATKYQILVSTNKNFKKAKTYTTKKIKYVVTNKKKVYIKVRAYTVSNGKKVYGKWCILKKK